MSQYSAQTAERRLRDAIAAFAHNVIPTPGPDSVNKTFTPECCKAVLDRAGIATTPAQFERAARTFRQLPFYGGNYTTDARRILKSIDNPPAEGVAP